MLVKLIADVHGDLHSVRKEASSCDVLLVLGDLINVIDYGSGGGILADVYGVETVRLWTEHRTGGRFDDARAVLRQAAVGREDEVRAMFNEHIERAHEAFCCGLPSNAIVTYGNVDVPAHIRRYLADGARFADAEVVELDGMLFGFVGGGLPKVGIPGEVSHDDYARKLSKVGPVDVLCSHVPPDLDDLTFDVVANYSEPGSPALLEYVRESQPGFVYFGHVHQPRRARVRVGRTLVVNVGAHFRQTGHAVVHPAEE